MIVKKEKLNCFIAALMILLLAGCAGRPQTPISLGQDFYSNKNKVVGVYMSPLPKSDMNIVGAGCLLCYAVASAANASLTSHVQTLSNQDLAILDDAVVKSFSQKGIEAKKISKPIALDKLKDFDRKAPGIARKNFTALKAELGVDELYVIEITEVGTYRPYSNYVPNSAPAGSVAGSVYLVNLATNQYELYQPINIKMFSEGEWDEPPAFPGITNAYYRAIESAKDQIINTVK